MWIYIIINAILFRLATKVESTPEGGFEISPGPPSVVPRAVVHVLSSYTYDSTLKGVDHARFPLQTGGKVVYEDYCHISPWCINEFHDVFISSCTRCQHLLRPHRSLLSSKSSG